MNTAIELTKESLDLFQAYAADAWNWSGQPLVSDGNISPTKEQRGNLSDLVKKGLIQIKTWDDPLQEQYIKFTDMGVEFAKTLGIDLSLEAGGL